MQVNMKKDEINNTEFYMESKYELKEKILSKICSLNFETSVKSMNNKLLIIFKNNEILLDIKLTDDSLMYRIDIIHSKPKIDKTFVYCIYDDVKAKDDFNKYLYQLRDDLSRLIKNVVFFDSNTKEQFIIDNEFKYSKDFEIPKRNKFLEYMDENI